MSQLIEVGSVLGGRYRVTEHDVTSADQDMVFTGLDQVLNRRVTILVASRENATQVAASARELAMGERHDEVQVLDLGMSEGRTYLIAGGDPDHDVLLGMAYPADTYIEPFQTDTLGSEIFGSSREAQAETHDDDEAYYSELEARVRADQEQTKRPGFLNRISERLSERVSSDSDGTAAKQASAAAAIAAAEAAEKARQEEQERELERQREEAERAEREAAEREERERVEREEAELRRREEQARREREEREEQQRREREERERQARAERERREREAAEAERRREERERREREDREDPEDSALAAAADDAPTAPISTVAAAGAVGTAAVAGSHKAEADAAPAGAVAVAPTGPDAETSRAAEPPESVPSSEAAAAPRAPRARRALGTGGSSAAASGGRSSSGKGGPWLTGALLLLLLIGIGVVGFLLLNQNRPMAGEADPEPSSSQAASDDSSAGSDASDDDSSAKGPAPEVAGLTRLVPDMPTLEAENDATLPQAADGNPDTAWQSYTYTRPNFGGYVSALQLVAELKEPAKVNEVVVDSRDSQGGAFSVSLASSPDGADATEVGTGAFTEGQNTVTVPEDAPEGQYVIVTVTELPTLTTESGARPYGLRLSEITVK